MKKIALSLVFAAFGFMYAQAQAVVDMNFKQNPLFEVSTNEVSAVMEGQPLTIGGDIVVAGGSGVYEYRWYTDQIDLGTERTVVITEPGTYYLEVKDQCDCLQTITFTITGEAATAVDAVECQFSVVPNPTYGAVSIKSEKPVNQLLVFTTSGALVKLVTEKNITSADLTTLPAATYILNLVVEGGKVLSTKVIKK